MENKPVLAVIGGSGLYKFPALKNTETLEIETPFGMPSSPIIVGELSGRKIAFLARHGIGHVYLPSEVNYRANIYALKSLGISRIVSVSACGSLREDYSPGHIVIPNQLVDLTHKRERTFFGNGIVAHIGSAEPYCEQLSMLAYTALLDSGATIHRGGTYITIEGPRFSTKAESNLYREWGMSVIGMTACPEAMLAREAEMCYTTMAHVTDYDVWHVSEEPVTVEMVVRVLQKNTQIAQESIQRLVERIPEEDDCIVCRHALENAIMTQPDMISADVRKKLNVLIDKYI
jgi:5'-methylthioadenosine phosphorylase